MQMTLRAAEPKLTDVRVRRAILGLLDVGLLATVGAGSDNTVTLAQAQIRTPSDPGYVPTAPSAMSDSTALALLQSAGYRVEKDAPPSALVPPAGAEPAQPHPPEITRGRISKAGEQLSLVIGVAANDPTSVAVANTAADQLRNVGIAATVLPLDPVKLYREALVAHQVDAIVGWQQAGGDLATLLASRYGCVALATTTVPTSGDPAPAPPPAAQSPSPVAESTTQTSKAPPSPAGSGALVQAPSNITGVCDRGIQAEIDAALDGSKPIGDVITAVEPRLWNMATVLPILQDTTIVAVGPSVMNVSLSGAVPVGIVGDAGTWVKRP
jgi:ABC-type transport system substrate-binding protein